MLALFTRLTGLDGAAARLVAVGLGLALAVAGWGLHQWRASVALEAARTAGLAEGRAAERSLWSAAAARERERQDEANATALAAAENAAVALRRERDDLARSLEDLAHDADAAPDRDALCLDADGLRAVNRHR